MADAGNADSSITLYGTNWCSDCKRSKKFFGEQRVQYRFVDIESDDAGMRIVEERKGFDTACAGADDHVGQAVGHQTPPLAAIFDSSAAISRSRPWAACW